MNYQHEYHAGNFADVTKHLLLLVLLNRLTVKDKPLHFIDTHAGAGLYDLSQAKAQKSGEFLNGIHKLVALTPNVLRDAPPTVQQYLELLSQIRSELGKGSYPGSIWWALQALRDSDQATAFEVVDQIYDALKYHIDDPRASIHHRDAYEGLNALIPPPQRRGLVLIDPPYEMERKDFPTLVTLLQKAHQKWQTGIYVLWYPIKDSDMIERFLKKMYRTGIRRQLVCELCVRNDDIQLGGLSGNGLLIINPPYGFFDDADRILQWLLPHLREDPTMGRATVRWLVGE